MKTYTIHGVDFPVNSDDGFPDLPSVVGLLNTLGSAAARCNGYGNADNGLGVYVFDHGWSGAYDAKAFAAKLATMAPFVTDIVITEQGRAAWGGPRVEVAFNVHTKFCYENVFGGKS